MPEIYIAETIGNWLYFNIEHNGNYYSNSEEISEFLNLPLDTYNQLLIDKVIKHSNYTITDESDYNSCDMLFTRKSISDEIYIDRFKETFVPQLVLFSF